MIADQQKEMKQFKMKSQPQRFLGGCSAEENFTKAEENFAKTEKNFTKTVAASDLRSIQSRAKPQRLSERYSC